MLPKSLIKKVIPQLKEMTNPVLEQHLFYTPVLNMPASFSVEDKKEIRKLYSDMITNKVIPTYQSIHDFVATDYLESGRESSGIDGVPQGEAYYKHQIKLYTTTDMTAEQIHTLGLNEVARILSEMEKVKNKIGFKGDLKAFFNEVRSNPILMPFKSPQEVIANFNAIHTTMKPQLERLFDKTPKTHEANLLLLDSSKAKSKLAWKPQWPLEIALDKTIEWHMAWAENKKMSEVSISQIKSYNSFF